MTRRCRSTSRAILTLLFLILGVDASFAQPAAGVPAFDAYVCTLESRLAAQHQSPSAFLGPASMTPQTEARLRRGEMIVENLTPANGGDLAGALLHHWRGTAFVPGLSAADLTRLLKDFNGYPQYFAPQVLQARVLSRNGDRLRASMRTRQRHGITVVLDATYDVAFTDLDPQHGYNISRSTQISEIASPGTADERLLGPGDEHGFLWRLNTYWTYEERAGGLYMQIESVSLTRSIPTGLGWVVHSFVDSIPRDSLEFTLRSVRNALLKRKTVE